MAKVSKDARSGKWIVRHVHDGTHHQKSFDLKKHADAYRLKIEGDLAAGSFIAKKDIRTVEDVCEAYLRWNEVRMNDGRITRRSWEKVKGEIDVSIIPNVGTKRMDTLTLMDVEKLYATMCRTLQPVTARMRVSTFKRVEEFGRRRGWTKSNVVGDALLDLRGVSSRPVRTFSQQQVMDLLSGVARHRAHDRDYAFCFRQLVINIAVFCGLRYGEIMGLTTTNINLDQRLIMVRHSWDRRVGLKKPKTAAGNRDVPMPAHVLLMLRDWLGLYHLSNPDNLVFYFRSRGASRGPLPTPEWHPAHWLPALRRAGLDTKDNQFHFHALRHFFASWQLAAGTPLTDVAAMMGHAKAGTTLETYAHALASGARRQAFIDGATERLIGRPSVSEDEARPRIAFDCVIDSKPLILVD